RRLIPRSAPQLKNTHGSFRCFLDPFYNPKGSSTQNGTLLVDEVPADRRPMPSTWSEIIKDRFSGLT
ncbi:MAG: hypothetical protein M3O09_18045, partial [Acidobacteriota bacterium]|nr:hypothetical protein [Acidobacteriota bacterium]